MDWVFTPDVTPEVIVHVVGQVQEIEESKSKRQKKREVRMAKFNKTDYDCFFVHRSVVREVNQHVCPSGLRG